MSIVQQVNIGDKVRITTTSEGIVEWVSGSRTGFELEGVDEYFSTSSQSVEILESAPKVLKVGDSVKSSDLGLLKHGTVLIDPTEAAGTPRVVDAERKYLVLNSVDKFPFSFYDDFYFPNFVIVYIPKG